MTTNEEKNAVARDFMALEYPQILQASLIVSPHPNGKIAVDTTRIYLSLDDSKQYHHSVRVKAASDDQYRSARRSDVIVQFVVQTCRHIHVTVDTKTNIVTFKLNFVPKKLWEQKKDEILKGLQTVLGPVTTLPKLLNP